MGLKDIGSGDPYDMGYKTCHKVSCNVTALIHSHFTRLGGRGMGLKDIGGEGGGRGEGGGGGMTTHSVVNLSLGLGVTMATNWFLPPPFVITLFVMSLTAGGRGEAW